ncbi:MAG: polysaccharide deacetylase family protein [Clostridia bacterium]
MSWLDKLSNDTIRAKNANFDIYRQNKNGKMSEVKMILTTTKKTIILVSITILLCIASLVGLSSSAVATVYSNKSLRKLPVYAVDTDSKEIALTFDAAWGADKTKAIIDILNKYNAKATFFLVGFWIKEYPELVQLIDSQGFDIGNHSQSHLKMSALSPEKIEDEIATVNSQILKLTNKTPKFFRAPFGDYNNGLIQSVTNKNMLPIQWSVDSLDWKGLSCTQILQRVSKNVKSGSIILCHNNSEHIVEALPLILTQLSGAGYKFVTMSQLVADKDYTIDSNGIQHKN